MGMFEVAIPAFKSRVESCNHAINRVSLVTLRLDADFISQGHQTFLAYPTLPCFKPVTQKLKPLILYPAIPNMSLVRMNLKKAVTAQPEQESPHLVTTVIG